MTILSFRKTLRLLIIVSELGTILCASLHAQSKHERFWLAGRYDGTRVLVYFDAVKFDGTLPPDAKSLNPGVASFYDGVEISPTFLERFEKQPTTEHFALGDKYDLLLDEDHVATVALTTLVGTETDEGVGNDSFVGALATVKGDDLLFFKKDYYVLRRHEESTKPAERVIKMEDEYTGIVNGPVEFATQAKIVALLTERMNTLASSAQRQRASISSPLFEVQAFRTARGNLRYYARIMWKAASTNSRDLTGFALGAWISPSPTLHILALENRTDGYENFGTAVPTLANVINLGGGRTGLIVRVFGDDSNATNLMEYKDGADLGAMNLLQSIGMGE